MKKSLHFLFKGEVIITVLDDRKQAFVLADHIGNTGPWILATSF